MSADASLAHTALDPAARSVTPARARGGMARVRFEGSPVGRPTPGTTRLLHAVEAART